jgi:hypothetical protein
MPKKMRYVGLDVHPETIAAAVFSVRYKRYARQQLQPPSRTGKPKIAILRTGLLQDRQVGVADAARRTIRAAAAESPAVACRVISTA